MTPEDIANKIISHVMGTCEDIHLFIDQCIEEGDFSSEFFNIHENEILILIDAEVFNCSACGWNCASSEMSEEDWICGDCYESE